MQNTNIIDMLRKNNAILLGGMREKIIKFKCVEENTDVFFNIGFDNLIILKKDEKIIKKIFVDDIDNAKYFLENIGLKKVGTLERYRLKWNYKGSIVNLDELPKRNFHRNFREREAKRQNCKRIKD